MDGLTSAFFDVMYKYKIPFTKKGVESNLETWRKNKADLVDMLRRHPNWNEEELAVVFQVTESRTEVDHMKVDEAKFAMMELTQHISMTAEERENFEAAFEAATVDYTRVPAESRLAVIQERGGIKCSAGQKASRIINRLCQHFRLDQYREDIISHSGEQRTVVPYNSIFAQMADALNPMEINKTAVLSVHPCDFLEMSNIDNPWHSCHCLSDGGYRAGCQSYMGDGVSMIFFTVDEDVTENFYAHRKLTREIFCFKDGVLLQSRLYPNGNVELQQLYRKIVQGTIATCMGLSNLWRVERNPLCTFYNGGEQELLWTTHEGSKHYADYNNGYAVVTYLRDMEDTRYPDIVIGSPSLCPCCGEENDWIGSLHCGNCNTKVVCAGCGEEVSKGSAHYVGGKYYCSQCSFSCDCCGDRVVGEARLAYSFVDGRKLELCPICFENRARACEACGVRDICLILGGGKLCARSGLVAA